MGSEDYSGQASFMRNNRLPSKRNRAKTKWTGVGSLTVASSISFSHTRFIATVRPGSPNLALPLKASNVSSALLCVPYGGWTPCFAPERGFF